MDIRVNGEEMAFPTQGLGRLTDVIELIKSNIDPEHMITEIVIDGRALDEADWTASPQSFGQATLEVLTNTPEEYVKNRLLNAHYLVQEIYMQFRDARKSFHEGLSVEGNRVLSKAVSTFQAFIEWYGSITALLSEDKRKEFDVSELVQELSKVCQTLCQRQLTQSWKLLGETIRADLEPKLEQLEDFCRSFRARTFV